MRRYKDFARKCLLYTLSVVIATGYPFVATATSDTPSTSESSGPTPGTVTESIAPEPVYKYNDETGHWDSDKWIYDPAAGHYTAAPQPATPVVIPEAPIATVPSSEIEATDGTKSLPLSDKDPTVPSTTSSTDTVTNVENGITSNAQTGNAGIESNTTAGNATSGDASGATTIINTVHSTIQGDTAGVAHFVSDINGNVFGDITLSPAINNAMSQTSGAPANTTTQVNTNTNLTNNVSLGATSGNADVSNNTTAGNATTGTANTVANIVNLINSIIAANKSFIGTINIHGNLNGDILISPSFIPQLLASNAPASSSPATTSSILGIQDTQAIINNISLSAATGNADVSNNTTAGNATTGTAATNLTILNYSGRQIVASNSLLVFVNVLGKWVGIIVDAPVGATAAVLGNGVTSNGSSPTTQSIDATSNSTITNNIDLASRSGDASVTGNTKAGNATSGNATASANIANITTSTFSISDWFGILFINVFGEWYGSFGVDTVSGRVIPINGSTVAPAVEVIQTNTTRQVPRFGFVPSPTFASSATPIVSVGNDKLPQQPLVADEELATLAAATFGKDRKVVGVPSVAPSPSPVSTMLLMASLIGGAAAIALGFIRR